MKKSILVFASVFISACVTGYTPGYSFNEIQVVNLSGATIQDVGLRVADSPKALSCAEVAKFAMCHDHFGKRRYPQQGIELSWTHPDGSRKSDTLNPEVPAFFSAALPLRIVLEIGEGGSVKAFYEQEEPDGGNFFMSAIQ